MSGFLGIGQSGGQKSDRGMSLNSWNQLNNVFNYAMPQSQTMQKTGQTTTAAGVGGLGAAGGYWQQLLSGGRNALTAAVAPERNMIASASDAQARQQASMGTARGGGVAGANQQRQTGTQAEVDQALLGLRPEAAKETAAIGGETASIGLNEQAEASRLLGLGAESSSTVGQQSMEDYHARAQQQSQLFGDITSGLALGLGLAA